MHLTAIPSTSYHHACMHANRRASGSTANDALHSAERLGMGLPRPKSWGRVAPGSCDGRWASELPGSPLADLQMYWHESSRQLGPPYPMTFALCCRFVAVLSAAVHLRCRTPSTRHDGQLRRHCVRHAIWTAPSQRRTAFERSASCCNADRRCCVSNVLHRHTGLRKQIPWAGSAWVKWWRQQEQTEAHGAGLAFWSFKSVETSIMSYRV